MLITATAAFACGRDPQAHADTTASDTAAADSATGEVAHQDTTKKDTTVLRDSTGKPIDPPITVRVPPGRPKKDSLALVSAVRVGSKTAGWPVKGPAPLPGSLLPQKRIVAFYGNPLSKKMGILGALPPDQMLAKLDAVVAEWRKADPTETVQPALHLIATVAQGAPGKDGKYRLRMDSSLIEQVYGWAHQRGAILFLDIQTGQATVQEELPRLLPFLARPDVHFGIDPEFHMHYDKEGVMPGRKIGTLTSAEVNYAIGQLSKLVAEKNLPPKVLIVHRFTRPMLRGAKDIRLDPRVQVVINMDGWGQPWLKYDSYKDYVVGEPVQFTGFKLFFGNDTKKGDKLLTPMEVLQLKPKPIYIQYQ
ncbi:MAG TPA: hypothetical protein VKH19_13785 [Gemmatimonadaceae bacterium]|nr:hypothetical protein [Gemmatimonadaceae bacterium]